MKGLRSYNKRVRKRYARYIQATPHRSFRLTRKRDIPRPVALPGYLAFTAEVVQAVRLYRMQFIKLALVLWIGSICMIGLAQQTRYTELREALQIVGKEVMGGKVESTTEVGTVFLSIATGGLNASLSESQQIFIGLLYILGWLTTIWLLRHLMAGHSVMVRDGLYNAGAPLVSVLALLLVAMLQLLPGSVGIMLYSVAQGSGLLVGGIEVGAFAVGTALLVVLSLYWVTSTFLAIAIATIPGTYPFAALRSARQLVAGQRRSILFRLLWLGLVLFVIFALVMVPAIAIDSWLQFSSYPFMTFVVQFISSVLLVFSSAYVYLLYRRIIDERAN